MVIFFILGVKCIMITILIITLGIIFTSIGLFFIILYFNLFNLGYNFLYFWEYIIKNLEFWLFILGIVLIYIGTERLIKDELLLRHNS